MIFKEMNENSFAILEGKKSFEGEKIGEFRTTQRQRVYSRKVRYPGKKLTTVENPSS